ncbi:MAG: terminase small subunit [Rubrivivax sp.]|nr:MAG: terminase small subunit [Rubrivivax sp.]
MATTRRSSVPPKKPTTSKPRARSDAPAKADKATTKGKPPAKPAAKPSPVKSARASKPKAVTKKVAAAALAPTTQAPNTEPPVEGWEALTPKQALFVRHYLISLNGTRAYLAAFPGVQPSTARSEAARLTANPSIASVIAAEQAKSAREMKITKDRLLREAWGIVVADPRELVDFKITCCRYCYGQAYRYQRTAGEMERDREQHEQALAEGGKGAPKGPFDEKGGIGYDPRLAPNDECPECFGAGTGNARIKDTSLLSPQALSLYAGVKVTKEGYEVKMHSKLDAGEKLFKHLGLYEKDNDQKSKGMGQVLAEFTAGLVARGAGKLPIAPPKVKGEPE